MLKTFISYKWEGDAHNEWVAKFVGDLRAAGIDAQLDRWEIRLGDSLTDYMTSRIDDADIVLCVITDEYVKNVEAPHGQGGATKFEMQMAVSRRTAEDKVRLIGIYRQGSKQPHYLRDHLYVDFRDDAAYDDQLKTLLDDLRGRSQRPPLGFPQLKEFDVWENSIGMKMVLLPAGQFLMGTPDSDCATADRESPQHFVRITKSLLMGVHPVTQLEYVQVEMRNPSLFSGDLHRPVENVSWSEAVLFCNRLSELEQLTPYYKLRGPKDVSIAGGSGYRLPTEAEWEYACRAGSQTTFSFGNKVERLGDFAWFNQNSERGTHRVGEKQLNAWGLHDMHGNVWEWCWDYWDDNYYDESPENDPLGPSTGLNRVYRGGGWGSWALSCRSAFRSGGTPEFRYNVLGFRVARSSV